MGFWKKLGEAMMEPVFLGPDGDEKYLEYQRIRASKQEIHLHQNNYYLVNKETGKRIKLDPNKFEIKEEVFDAEAEEIE